MNRDRFITTERTYDHREIMAAAHKQTRETLAYIAKKGGYRQTTYAAEFAKALRYCWAHASIAFRSHEANLPAVLANCVSIAAFENKKPFSLRPVW